jgi:hypothetical protein
MNAAVIALTPAGLRWYDARRETTRSIPLSYVQLRISGSSTRREVPGLTVPRPLQIADF